MRLFVGFLAIVVTAVLAPGNAWASPRVALLIANQDYQPGVGRLVNPRNDIRIVGAALRKIGFRVLQPVVNATRADILEALDTYANALKHAGPDAVGFIYYSGHGIASRGTNYLIPVDVERPTSKQLRAYGLRQQEILSILQSEAPNAAHYLVIDACRNELQGSRGGKGFVAVNQQAGALIAFATSPGQTASDIGEGSGPYAKALAAEIVKPGVPDLLMFHQVGVAVRKATDGDQVPWTLDGIQRERRLMFGGATLSTKPARSPVKMEPPKRTVSRGRSDNQRRDRARPSCTLLRSSPSTDIEMANGMVFCDAQQKNTARVVKISNRRVTFSVNRGRRFTCAEGDLCGFNWPSRPLFRITARADAAKGIKPSARMLPR